MDTKPHISIQNLSVFFGPLQVLKDISIDIPDRRITVVIGPSGCGKTTLLRSLNRLLDPSVGVRVSGRVLVDDVDIYDPRTEVTQVRKKMGLLSQRPQALPMSIYDNVAYGPRIHGLRAKKDLDQVVESHLRVAGLWEEVQRFQQPAKYGIDSIENYLYSAGFVRRPSYAIFPSPFFPH